MKFALLSILLSARGFMEFQSSEGQGFFAAPDDRSVKH